MLRRIRHPFHFEICAVDGQLGRIQDFLIDDQSWKVRYFVVDVARWFPGRRVLLPPNVAGPIDWEKRQIPIKLTRAEVHDSPDVITEQLAQFQHLVPIHAYYGWPFWEGIDVLASKLAGPTEPLKDLHLRSARDLLGYEISEIDDDFGNLADFIFDELDWQIRYLVMEMKRWFQKRYSIVSPKWATEIDWVSRHIKLDLPIDKIRKSPSIDLDAPLDALTEFRISAHFGHPPDASHPGGNA